MIDLQQNRSDDKQMMLRSEERPEGREGRVCEAYEVRREDGIDDGMRVIERGACEGGNSERVDSRR